MAEQGHYYKKQIECGCSVISWSHRNRFDTAAKLLGTKPIGRLLDYGCGDGTFLASLSEGIRERVGADIAEGQILDCAKRLQGVSNLRFCHVDELIDPAHEGAYDVVTCMETLEHCTDPAVDRVLADLARLCAPGGRVIISVPIETGLTFLLKKAFRTIAAWRGLSDYKYYERYALKNAWRMMTAGKRMKLPRPVYGTPESPYCSHYGFNWRLMRERVMKFLDLERTQFSPLNWLGGVVSSQAWFTCRPRKAVPV